MLEINKIYQGDCLEVMKDVPDDSVDLIVTDPPYEVQVNGGGSINTIKKLNKSLNEGIVKANIVNGFDYEKVISEWDRVMKNINIYIFCSKKQIPIYFEHYVYKKKCTFDIIVWHKNNALPTYSNKYLTDCEYILHFRKGAKCKPQSYEDAKTVFLGSINHKDKKLYGHPTVKPLQLVEKLIRNSSSEGEIVLDTFCGSGTTCVACERLNRNYIGIEISPEYCELSEKRINNAIDK